MRFETEAKMIEVPCEHEPRCRWNHYGPWGIIYRINGVRVPKWLFNWLRGSK